LALFAPADRSDVLKNFTRNTAFAYATRLAPGSSLTDDDVRVKGTMTFAGRTLNGVRELDVPTDFVWGYPFGGPRASPGDHLVALHDTVKWAFPAEADVDSGSRGMYFLKADAYASNVDCDKLRDHDLIALGTPSAISGIPAQDNAAAFDPG